MAHDESNGSEHHVTRLKASLSYGDFTGRVLSRRGVSATRRCFDDGRELELLQFVLDHPDVEQFKGNPQKVLDAIDEFGRTRKYLMNVGEYKSKTVVGLIKARKPQVMVELGGYVGYSAIAFATALREAGGNIYYSLEKNPGFGKVITKLVDLAGLGDMVKVVVGSSSESLRQLHADGALAHIDLLFLDHYKPLYTDDQAPETLAYTLKMAITDSGILVKICEELGLIQVDTILAADNGKSQYDSARPIAHA
ncbi:hypothetical protein CHU98_g6050 [Xylaria longipes]|nr:hypothetical protein CHU98_g6050 [Xylaria longipes]